MPAFDASLIAAITAVLIALITGLFASLQNRKKMSVDATATIQAGFTALLEDYQGKLKEAQDELRLERAESAEQIKLCREAAEQLQQKINDLAFYIAKLEHFLRSRGLWEEAPKHGYIGMPAVNGEGTG